MESLSCLFTDLDLNLKDAQVPMETGVARFHYNGFKILLSFRKANIIKAFFVVVCIHRK